MKSQMNYFSLSGSCLFSIMIPENLLIGCYVKFFKNNGIKNVYLNMVHICVLLLGGAGICICVTQNTEPYIPFVLFGGLIVGIVQSMISYRRIENYQTNILFAKSFLSWMKIIFGVVIIFVPFHFIFQNYILHFVCKEVRFFCCFIYLVWGMEEILFNLYDFFHNIK